jgi:hypothetical protein
MTDAADARKHPRRRTSDTRSEWLKRQAELPVPADTTLADRAPAAPAAGSGPRYAEVAEQGNRILDIEEGHQK